MMRWLLIVPITLTLAQPVAYAENSLKPTTSPTYMQSADFLKVGDIVFIHINSLLFRKIARDTNSWTNHVGIIVDVSGKEPQVAESTFPFSKITPLSAFIKRSKSGKVEIKRYSATLTVNEEKNLKNAAQKRLGIFYDTGFNLHSKRQFCSRFVYEVMYEATGRTLGKVETLSTLFSRNPDTDLRFWKLWYFGAIPWDRETVTPTSQLDSDQLYTVVSGQDGQYTLQP